MAGNAIMRLIFANTLSHRRAVLFSFALEFTEFVLEILSYTKCMIGPAMVGLEEKVLKLRFSDGCKTLS